MHPMRCLLLLLWASSALAQGDLDDLTTPGDDLPVEGAIRGRTARPGSIGVDVAEVRAGPGEAYISRGRAYQGDALSALRRNEAGDWIEVDVGGLRGWVRGSEITFDEAAPVDAGRDRRRTNDRYDKHGRRLRPDGTRAGSGEGTQDDEIIEEDAPDDPPSAGRLRLFLVLGAGKVGRDFSSDIDSVSILDRLSGGATGLSTTVGAEWAPKRWLLVRGLFRDSRLGAVTVGAQPAAGFADAVELAVDAQQLELDAVGGYPVGPTWLGAYAGARMLRHAFQQTAPFPIFLTDTYLGLGLGARARAAFGRFDATLEGGLVVPLATSQAPHDSGAPEASGFELRVEAGFALSTSFAVVGQAYLTEITADFTGVSQHHDTINDQRYTRAKSVDGALGGGLGLRWTAF